MKRNEVDLHDPCDPCDQLVQKFGKVVTFKKLRRLRFSNVRLAELEDNSLVKDCVGDDVELSPARD